MSVSSSSDAQTQMEALAAQSGRGLTFDASRVLEEHDTPLGRKFAGLVGRICTAIANATAISIGIDVAKLAKEKGDNVDVLASMPEPTREQVEAQQRELAKRLSEHWNNPLCEELEFVLQKRVNKEECRHLAFFPDERQIERYALLVQDPPDGAPKEHPQRKIRSMFMSLLYLVHVEDWGLMRRFIVAGGILALSDHIHHKSEGVRTQAIDVIHRLTSTPYFDWFAAPADHSSKELHSAFLRLSQSSFVKNLLSNVPGGMPSVSEAEKSNQAASTEPSLCSFYSLQILAFWLSWVRKLYSQNGELRLSHEILGTLQRWSKVDPSTVSSPEEIELARKVYEDFGRLPAADDVEGHRVDVRQSVSSSSQSKEGSLPPAPSSSSPVVTMNPPRKTEFKAAETFQGPKEGFVFKSGDQGMGYYTDFSVAQQKEANVTSALPTSSSTHSQQSQSVAPTRMLSKSHISPAAQRAIEARSASLRADAEKSAGNNAFSQGDFNAAIERYSAAISHDPTRSVLYANRAAAYLELTKKASPPAPNADGNSDEGEDLDDANQDVALTDETEKLAKLCVKDCDAALRLHPTYIKALFRRAQGWLLLAVFDEALKDVDGSIDYARKELKGKPPKKRTAELKKMMRRMRDWKLRAQNRRDAFRRKQRGWSNLSAPSSAVARASSATSKSLPKTDVLKSSLLGSGILGALMKRDGWDRSGPADAAPNELEPAEADPDPSGGSGLLSQSGQSVSASESSLVAAMDATRDSSLDIDMEPSVSASHLSRKAAAKNRKSRIETRAAASNLAANATKSAASATHSMIGKASAVKKKTKSGANKKSKKKVEGRKCTVAGVGEVQPPRTALAVEEVIRKALKRDPSGASLAPYFSFALPPTNFRRVLKEQINEVVLVGIITVATHLSKVPDHESLLSLLSGLSRVKRLETALMFLEGKHATALKSVLEDVVGEQSAVDKVREKFECLF